MNDRQLEAAAKKLAECMDYPWDQMPEQGRCEMRKHALAVIDAAKLHQAGAVAVCPECDIAGCHHLRAPTAQSQQPGPVIQKWLHAIPMMQQSVLLAAVRGPDGLPKYGGGAKMLLRFYRRCILLSAMDRRVLADPIDPSGGSFTGPSLDGTDDLDPWTDRMQAHVNDYLRQLDALPHHWQMHFMHAVEIVGYKHPDNTIRHFWHQVYMRLVHDMHVWPESEQQLDDRLGDTRSGWLRRADPATTA